MSLDHVRSTQGNQDNLSGEVRVCDVTGFGPNQPQVKPLSPSSIPSVSKALSAHTLRVTASLQLCTLLWLSWDRKVRNCSNIRSSEICFIVCISGQSHRPMAKLQEPPKGFSRGQSQNPRKCRQEAFMQDLWSAETAFGSRCRNIFSFTIRSPFCFWEPRSGHCKTPGPFWP